MAQITEKNYVKEMLEKGLFAVVFPKDKKESTAEEMVDLIDSAVGIAQFKDENENDIYGVLIDKIKEAKKHIKLNSSQKDEEN